MRQDASRSGFSLERVAVLDLAPAPQASGEDAAYNLLESWEVEGGALHDRIVAYAREHRPERVFIDSLSELRYLSPDAFQFRKQVLSVLRQLTADGASVMFTVEQGSESDQDLQFLSDGVIQLGHAGSGRVCSIGKFRGSGFQAGQHHYGLDARGMTVYPRLHPGSHGREFLQEMIASGVPELEELIGGGIHRGTVSLLSGPTGVGKTTLGAHFMKEAAARGERSVVYSFDEHRTTFLQRSRHIDLLRARPSLDAAADEDLPAIPGVPPDPRQLTERCAFAPRCARASQDCRRQPALEAVGASKAACHHPIGVERATR